MFKAFVLKKLFLLLPLFFILLFLAGSAFAQSAPVSFWDNSTTPTTPSGTDTNAVELGVKFQASQNGFVTGIKFYKGSTNTGTHVANLWTLSGTNLATATFVNETASGWQQVSFANPVAITAGTTYVASYHAPAGGYSINRPFFSSAFTNGPLTALSDSSSGGNGVYRYGTSGFPTSTYQATNYWVDVIFQTNVGPDTTAPTVTTTSPLNNATNISVSADVTATFSEALDQTTINTTTFELKTATGSTVPATVSYNSQVATLNPSADLEAATTYTATIKGGGSDPRVKDVAGNALAQDFTFSFTTSTPIVCSDNPIVCENQQPGNPASEWDVAASGFGDIQGFADGYSFNVGELVNFKVKTPASNYRIDIYRVGYYNGNGARKITTIEPSVSLPQTQPNCINVSATGLNDCGNWANSASWQIPGNAVSGVYLGKLVREDSTAGASLMIFVVRNDSANSDVLFQTSDTTWQAYNTYGGNSLYTGQPAGRAYKVSYNRPLTIRHSGCCGGSIESNFFNSEYPFIRWLERNGYDVSYFGNIDTARRGSEILEHKLFLSVGHDEYWSNEMLDSAIAARNNGVNLAFFSGNEVFWKTRWENSVDGNNQPFRTLVSYKETHANAKIDPSPLWTGTWRDPRFSPPSDGGRPEHALMGTLFRVNGVRNDAMQVPFAYKDLRLWRNTSIANLTAGQTATFPDGTLGFEWDEAPDDDFTPLGLIKLSETTINVIGKVLTDYGSNYGGTGLVTHNLTLYKQPNGGLVFGAGTTQWSWGLDAVHDRSGGPVDPRMQQATINLFADMNVQPDTLQSGLVPATKSTDTIAPTTVITSPTNNSTIPSGAPITISGTATDQGGIVAGVEISTNNGTTWRRASGKNNWQYNWTPSTSGQATILVRSMDDSANRGANASVTITVSGTPPPPPPPSGTLTITFDDKTGQNANLTGQYPTGLIDWGSSHWYHAAPWGQFTTKNVSFRSQAQTSGVFTFLSPRRIVSFKAFNGGSVASTITLACTGNTTKSVTAPIGQITTISTDWSNTCTTITLTSSNGWNTNFDDFVVDEGGTPDTTPPTVSLTAPAEGATVLGNNVTVSANASDDVAIVGVQFKLDGNNLGSEDTTSPYSISWDTTSTTNGAHVLTAVARDNTNTTTSGAVNVTVNNPVDSTPPVISAVNSGNLSTTGATITWTTDENSDTQVEYGTTTSYGSSTTLNTALVTNHSQALSGLTANTTYNYRVKSKDALGNLATSDNFTFTTPVSAPQTITFEDKTGQNQVLNGQYPTGIINWGTNIWFHSGPWKLFTTKSISFNGSGQTSGSFSFITPKKLISLKAFNGGTVASTVTLSCSGNTNKVVSVAVNQILTITTDWANTCSTVSVQSTNGWNTNFDDLVIE